MRLLRALRDTPEVGPLLATKLLSLGLLIVLGLLLLSNVIAALSSYFLARDLPTVLSAPVDWLPVYGSRLVETLIGSSCPARAALVVGVTIGCGSISFLRSPSGSRCPSMVRWPAW